MQFTIIPQIPDVTAQGKPTRIVVRRVMQQAQEKVIRDPIVAPGDSLCLEMLPNEAVIKKLCKYDWKVTEEEIWRVENYKWLSDASVNMYIANSIEAANNSFDNGVEPNKVQEKVSLNFETLTNFISFTF